MEDDSVEDSAITVDAAADDFTVYNSLGAVTLNASYSGVSSNKARISITAARAEGADQSQPAVIDYTVYETSGSDPVTGQITIPANSGNSTSNVTLNEYTAGSTEAGGRPGAAYIYYTPVSGCVLGTDDSGNPVNSTSVILNNGYNGVHTLSYGDKTNSYSNSSNNGIVTSTEGASGLNVGNAISTSTLSVLFTKLSVPRSNLTCDIHIGTMLENYASGIAADEKTCFRVNASTYYSSSDFTNGCNGNITLKSGNNVLDSHSNYEINKGYTTKWMKVSDLSNGTAHLEYTLNNSQFNDKIFAIYLSVDVCGESSLSAEIPGGHGATPVIRPGDTVPILIRSTTPAFSGKTMSMDITYPSGNSTKTVNCSNVAATYGDCSVLFNWTAPEDFTGGTLSFSNFVNNGNSIALTGVQPVNCDLNYSDKLASFDTSSFTTAKVNDEIVLKLPVRMNSDSWWNWIVNEVGKDFLTSDSETALKSMYATFGSSTDKVPIYVHGDVDKETIDYVYIKLPDGQMNAVHIWYDPAVTTNDYLADGADTSAVKEAFYADRRYLIAGLSAAATEFSVAEYDKTTKTDTKPADQTYYTLDSTAAEDLTLSYNETWNHFAGNDDEDEDVVTSDSEIKIVPPAYETYLSENGASPLTITYNAASKNADGKKYSYNKVRYFHWVSSDESIATISEPHNFDEETASSRPGQIEFTGKTGEVTFSLVCDNGKHPVAVQSAKVVVSDSPDPYLYVPTTSNPVITRQGLATKVNFVSNIAQRNAAFAGNDEATTVYSLTVRDEDKNVVYEGTVEGSLADPKSSISIPEGTLNDIGTYTAVVKAAYTGDKLSLGTADEDSYTEENGQYIFKTKTKINVKASPATVKMILPENLKGEKSNFVLDTDNPKISWKVSTNNPDSLKWKYEITDSEGNKIVDSESKNAYGTSVDTMPTSWYFPEVGKDKLKEIYTITVYVTNDELEDGWTIASARMYVYNGDALDILVHADENLDSSSTADNAKLDNRELLKSYLSSDGKTLDLKKKNSRGNRINLAELQNDINLSAVISLNYGDYTWGSISDQISWSAEGSPDDAGILYYKQASQYVNTEDLSLDSVYPTSELIEQGLTDGKVKITATHAGTGQSTTVNVDIDDVKDVFYMFQFYPKAKTDVQYTDGNGKKVTVTSDENGQLALYEENGIDETCPIYLRSYADVYGEDDEGNKVLYEDKCFVGVIEPGDLVTGEEDNVQHELYPVNTHNLTNMSEVDIYVKNPDGTPYSGKSIIYRGGAYYGGEYAERADIFTWNTHTQANIGDDNTSNGLEDQVKQTQRNGRVMFFFNPQQVANGEIDYTKDIQYVFEIRTDGYRPAIVTINPFENNTATVTLQNVQDDNNNKISPDSVNGRTETFTNQILLHRTDSKGNEKTDSLAVTGNTSKVGPNSQYPSASLEYETYLWNYGDLIETTAKGSKLKKNSLTQYFYDTDSSGSVTTLGNGYTVKNKSQTSKVWIYPFSSFPIVTTTLDLDKDCFGVTERGEKTSNTWLEKYKSIASNVYIYNGSKNVKKMSFEYKIFNGVGITEPLHSRQTINMLYQSIYNMINDMSDFDLSEAAPASDFLNPIMNLINGAMNNGQGFTVKPYFAATSDPTEYYVFMNMQKGTVDTVVDSILGNNSDPTDEVHDYIENTSQYGINPSYDEYENLFQKMTQPTDDDGNAVTLDSFANRHLQGTLDVGGGGAMLCRAKYDPEKKEWHLYYLSGTIDSFIQVGYATSFYFEGICVRVGAEIGEDKMFQAKTNYEKSDIERYDLVRQLSLGGGIECFVGQGFEFFIVYELGIVGQVKLTSSNAQMTSSLASYASDGSDVVKTNTGSKKDLTGRIALRLRVGCILYAKTFDLASTKFTLGSWPSADYSKLRDVYDGKATYSSKFGDLSTLSEEASYTATTTEDGEVVLMFERDEMKMPQLLGAIKEGESIYKTYESDDSISNAKLSDDGKYVFFLDNASASWASADGTSLGTIVPEDKRNQSSENNNVGDYGEYYLDTAGSEGNLFAAWSTQTQNILTEGRNEEAETEADAYTDEFDDSDLGAALNSTEITVAHHDGEKWTTTNLTKNSSADLCPQLASNGKEAIVAWMSGSSADSEDSDSVLDTINFDADNKIMFSRYDGKNWDCDDDDDDSNPGIVVNTTGLGTVSGMDVEMMDDGTAVVAYTVQPDDDDSAEGQEVYYSIIAPDGTVTTSRVTENKVADGNVKLQSVGDEIVLAWYTEETEETEATDTSSADSSVTGDIRLLGIKEEKSGKYSIDQTIPESIAADDTEVVSSFDMAGDSLNGLTIAWLLPEDSDDEGALTSSSALYGVQLYSDGDRTVVSPAQKLNNISTAENITASDFQLQADGSSVKALLMENDYTTGKVDTYQLDPADFPDAAEEDLTVEIPVASDKLEKAKSDQFNDSIEVTDISYSEDLVAEDTELPVWMTVRNNGVHKITNLRLNGETCKADGDTVTLYPGESATIETTAEFADKITDYDYTITAESKDKDADYKDVSGTVRFNIPEISVSDVSVSKENPGERTISMEIGTANQQIPLTGSGRTLTVGLYTDLNGTTPITDPVEITDADDLKLIDKSTLTVNLTTTMEKVNKALSEEKAADDSIPASGIPVYVLAEVKDGDTTVSTARNMTSIMPLSDTDDTDADALPVETGSVSFEQSADTDSVTVSVDYSNPLLRAQTPEGYTKIQLYNDKNVLVGEKFISNESVGTVAGESTVTKEYTIDIPKDTTVCLATADIVDDITVERSLTASRYKFNGWYTDSSLKTKYQAETAKDEDGKMLKDEDGNVIYQPVQPDENGEFVIYAKWSLKTSGSSADSGSTVDIGGTSANISITDHTAVISELTDDQISAILDANKDQDAVTVDLSSVDKEVTGVSIPANAVKAIAESEENGDKGLVIKLPESTVTFDAEALDKAAEQTNGSELTIGVAAESTDKLNEKQQKAVDGADVQGAYKVTASSDGNNITDFGNGSATVQIPYELKDGQKAEGIVVWLVSEDGTKTQVPATEADGQLTFSMSEPGTYVVVYDEEQANACPKDETCPMTSFTDLDKTMWYHDGIHWALENSVMNGVGDSLFDPDGDTSRAMIVTMLWRMSGEPKADADTTFTDVDDGQWYSEAVRWAAASKIVEGYSAEEFGPSDSVTREQLATILERYAKYEEKDVTEGEKAGLEGYTDADKVSDWALKGLSWAVNAGIINGVSEDTLSPETNASRAQVAAMLMRYKKMK